jgi:hypothetical protein
MVWETEKEGNVTKPLHSTTYEPCLRSLEDTTLEYTKLLRLVFRRSTRYQSGELREPRKSKGLEVNWCERRRTKNRS